MAFPESVGSASFTLYLVPMGEEDDEVMEHLQRELGRMGARVIRERGIPVRLP